LSLPYKGTVIDNQLKGESNTELTQFLAELPKLLSKLGSAKKVFKFIIEHPTVRGTRVGRYCRALQYHLAEHLGEPIHLRRIRFVQERTNELLPEYPLRVRVQVRTLNPEAITLDLVRSITIRPAGQSELDHTIMIGSRGAFLKAKQEQIRREAYALFPLQAQENANAAPDLHNQAPLHPPAQVGERRQMNEVVPEEQNGRRTRQRTR